MSGTNTGGTPGATGGVPDNTGGTPGAAGGTPGATGGTPWYQGKATPEQVGLWQNKGWKHEDPIEVALAATKAYDEAQRFVGMPHDEIVRFPKNPNDAGWNTVYERLGVPKELTGYDLSSIKFSDGDTLDPAADAFIRKAAFEAHIPANVVPQFAQEFVRFMEGVEQTEGAQQTAKLQLERKALTDNWGVNYEANKFIASQGAKALGFTPEMVSALEQVGGYATVMEAFRRVGKMNGEDRYIASGFAPNSGIMTKEAAAARLVELKRDHQWTTKLLSGDFQTKQEFQNLNMIMVG